MRMADRHDSTSERSDALFADAETQNVPLSQASREDDVIWKGRIDEKTLEDTQEKMSKSPAGNTGFKIHVDAVRGHDAICSMECKPDMKNSAGILMGGYTFILADFTGGAADVMPGLEDCMHTTVDAHMQYLAPGDGTRFVAHAICEHYGRKIAYYSIHIYNESGRHIAKGSFTYMHLV